MICTIHPAFTSGCKLLKRAYYDENRLDVETNVHVEDCMLEDILFVLCTKQHWTLVMSQTGAIGTLLTDELLEICT